MSYANGLYRHHTNVLDMGHVMPETTTSSAYINPMKSFAVQMDAANKGALYGNKKHSLDQYLYHSDWAYRNDDKYGEMLLQAQKLKEENEKKKKEEEELDKKIAEKQTQTQTNQYSARPSSLTINPPVIITSNTANPPQTIIAASNPFQYRPPSPARVPATVAPEDDNSFFIINDPQSHRSPQTAQKTTVSNPNDSIIIPAGYQRRKIQDPPMHELLAHSAMNNQKKSAEQQPQQQSNQAPSSSLAQPAFAASYTQPSPIKGNTPRSSASSYVPSLDFQTLPTYTPFAANQPPVSAPILSNGLRGSAITLQPPPSATASSKKKKAKSEENIGGYSMMAREKMRASHAALKAQLEAKAKQLLEKKQRAEKKQKEAAREEKRMKKIGKDPPQASNVHVVDLQEALNAAAANKKRAERKEAKKAAKEAKKKRSEAAQTIHPVPIEVNAPASITSLNISAALRGSAAPLPQQNQSFNPPKQETIVQPVVYVQQVPVPQPVPVAVYPPHRHIFAVNQHQHDHHKCSHHTNAHNSSAFELDATHSSQPPTATSSVSVRPSSAPASRRNKVQTAWGTVSQQSAHLAPPAGVPTLPDKIPFQSILSHNFLDQTNSDQADQSSKQIQEKTIERKAAALGFGKSHPDFVDYAIKRRDDLNDKPTPNGRGLSVSSSAPLLNTNNALYVSGRLADQLKKTEQAAAAMAAANGYGADAGPIKLTEAEWKALQKEKEKKEYQKRYEDKLKAAAVGYGNRHTNYNNYLFRHPYHR